MKAKRVSNLIAASNLSGVDALLEGDIAEIVMYNRALSTAERIPLTLTRRKRPR
jgi:hypothetical protein